MRILYKNVLKSYIWQELHSYNVFFYAWMEMVLVKLLVQS